MAIHGLRIHQRRFAGFLVAKRCGSVAWPPKTRLERLRRCGKWVLCLINLISCAFLSDVAKVDVIVFFVYWIVMLALESCG